MQVVILAGGLGTRLRAVSAGLPKSLVPVAGKPFIAHQLALLNRQGLSRVLLCVGHRAGAIQEYLGDGRDFGCRISYATEPEDRLLGTGGALVNALPLLDDRFLVLYGDSYLPTDYRSVVDAFTRAACPALMTVFRNQGKWDSSNVRVSGDRVAFYSKQAKPGEADYIDYGLSAFTRTVIESYRNSVLPLDLARILMDRVARNELAAHVVQERFYEIGKPEGLAELNALLGGARDHEGSHP